MGFNSGFKGLKYALKQASSTRYSWATSYERHSVMLPVKTLEMRKRVFKISFPGKAEIERGSNF